MHSVRCMSTRLPALRITEELTASKLSGFTRSLNSHSLLVAVIPASQRSALHTPRLLGVHTARSPEDWGQEIVKASWLGLPVLSTVHKKCGSGVGSASSCANHMSCHRWTGTSSKSTGIPLNKHRWYTAPVSLLGKSTSPTSPMNCNTLRSPSTFSGSVLHYPPRISSNTNVAYVVVGTGVRTQRSATHYFGNNRNNLINSAIILNANNLPFPRSLFIGPNHLFVEVKVHKNIWKNSQPSSFNLGPDTRVLRGWQMQTTHRGGRYVVLI
jgi:hypothetical protein